MVFTKKSQFFVRWKSTGDLLHSNVNIFKTIEHLKVVRVVNIMLCIFYFQKPGGDFFLWLSNNKYMALWIYGKEKKWEKIH